MGSSGSRERKSVIVVGGGYAGSKIAKGLDGKMQVTLIEKEDGLTNRVATLRGAVVPGWESRARVSLMDCVRAGVIKQAAVARVESGKVTMDSGEELTADFIVMATGGPGYNFPMGAEGVDSTDFQAMLKEAQTTISNANSILVVGGGPVGVEMAGEIKAAHPDKQVTLVNGGSRLLSGAVQPLADRLVESLMQQLEAMNVKVVLGARLEELPPSPDGLPSAIRPTPGATYALTNGDSVAADLVFVATGPRSAKTAAADLLPEAAIDGSTGLVKVNEALQVENMEGVYAIGDCTNVQETKMAYLANMHCKIALNNILQEAYRAPDKVNLKPYVPPEAKDAAMFVPLGPAAGASAMGSTFLGPKLTTLAKSKGLLTNMLLKERGLIPPPLLQP